MATTYILREVREQIEAEGVHYEEHEGEERAAKWDRQAKAAVRLIEANPIRAGVPVARMPGTHRRILIGKTHWLYFRVSSDGSDVLIYWIHGKSQESKKLPPSGLKRKATEATKERNSGDDSDDAS